MSLFDQIKKINDHGQEYWSARDLYKVLEYTEYGKFLPTIHKAELACQSSKQQVTEHFAQVSEPQKSRNQYGETEGQVVSDYHLSRYACYLIAMEADSRKDAVALAKSYFALQTRRQEMTDQYLEDQRRVELRAQVTEHNKSLAKTAKKAGVHNFGTFVDYGYMGLYGMRHRDILQKKKLKQTDSLMDNVNSEELAANLFRTTQAEAKIKREKIHGEDKANKAHLEVGKEVRTAIEKIGGMMPEKLPKSDNIKEAKKRVKGRQFMR